MDESEWSTTDRHWLSVILCRVYCVQCNNPGLR